MLIMVINLQGLGGHNQRNCVTLLTIRRNVPEK